MPILFLQELTDIAADPYFPSGNSVQDVVISADFFFGMSAVHGQPINSFSVILEATNGHGVTGKNMGFFNVIKKLG